MKKKVTFWINNIEDKNIEHSINGDWASGYWGVGGYGGLLKRVKRSIMTFPDAQYAKSTSLYINLKI